MPAAKLSREELEDAILAVCSGALLPARRDLPRLAAPHNPPAQVQATAGRLAFEGRLLFDQPTPGLCWCETASAGASR